MPANKIKSALFALGALTVVRCVSMANDRGPASTYAERVSRYFNKVSPKFSVGHVDLKRATSVEAFLALLPETMRTNYALVYESDSLQDATYENPRAVVFDDVAENVVTVAGHAGMAGGEAVEAMEYNWTDERYDLVEYDYSGLKVVRRVNESKCQACHTTANAPLWAGYATWRGSYGANHNIFATKTVDVIRDGFETYRQVSGQRDAAAFVAFTRTQARHPRYGQLRRPANEPLWPFSSIALNPPREAIIDAFDYDPNRRLGIGLRFHQGRSNAVRLLKSRLFRDYPAHLTAYLLQCRNERETVTAEWEKRLREISLASGFKRSAGAVFEIAGLVPFRFGLHDRKRPTGPTDDEGADMGFSDMSLPGVIEGAILWDTLRARVAPGLGPDGPTPEIARSMGATIAVVSQLNRVAPLYANARIRSAICPALTAEMARELRPAKPIGHELNAAQKRELLDHASGTPYVLQRCTVCHAAGNYAGAPLIPFDRPGEMARALREPATTSRRTLFDEIKMRTEYDAKDDVRMPKGSFGLPRAEQAQLLEYLNTLR